MGKETKYPSLEFIHEFRDWYRMFKYGNDVGSISLHVCGKAVSELLHIVPTPHIELEKVIELFDRVQLNINLDAALKAWSLQPLQERIVELGGQYEIPFILQHNDINKLAVGKRILELGRQYQIPFILQYNDNNRLAVDHILNNYDNRYINILKDASGGNGIYTEDFTIPQSCTHCAIGFSGGLGPLNVGKSLIKIHNSVMSENVEGRYENNMFWIDMESNIRTDDKLDLHKVRQVAEIVNQQYKAW